MGDAVVVIGVGNPDRGDDGVGPEVVSRLEAVAPPWVRLVRTMGADPAMMMEAWAGAARAIVVDAIVSGAAPGAVCRFDASEEPLPARVSLVSTHALGAGGAVEVARALGRLPEHLVVYGVEAAGFEVGSGLSADVAAAVEQAVSMILEEVGGA